MEHKADRLATAFRKAMADSGAPQSAFCARAGIDPGLMSRFMAGKGALGLANLEALADLLGLELIQTGKPKVKPGFAKPGRKPKRKGKVQE
jgi:hypothetical protein